MAQHYEITGQRQTDKLTSDGSFVPIMEVSFTVIPEGVNAMVPIDLRNYNAEYVAAAIEQRVEAIKSVANL